MESSRVEVRNQSFQNKSSAGALGQGWRSARWQTLSLTLSETWQEEASWPGRPGGHGDEGGIPHHRCAARR